MANSKAEADHATTDDLENPKLNPDPTNSNQIKDPDDWTTGHEPVTGAQAS